MQREHDSEKKIETIEEISDPERQKILTSTTFDMPKFEEIQVHEKTVEIIEKSATKKEAMAIAPIKYKIDYNNTIIYLSELFIGFKKYPILFAYIQNSEYILEPRIIYFSQSRVMWRVAPYIENNFNKGRRGFSCDIPARLNFILIKKFDSQIKENKFINFHYSIDYFIRRIASSSLEKKYEDEIKIEINSIINFSDEEKIDEIPKNYKGDEIDRVLLEAKEKGILPDITKIKYATVYNKFYDDVYSDQDNSARYSKEYANLHLFLCPSVSGQLEYLYAMVLDQHHMNKPIVFLLTIANSNDSLNSFCLPKTIVNLGYTSHPPIVHRSDPDIKHYVNYFTVGKKSIDIDPIHLIVKAPGAGEDYSFLPCTDYFPLNQIVKDEFVRYLQLSIQTNTKNEKSISNCHFFDREIIKSSEKSLTKEEVVHIIADYDAYKNNFFGIRKFIKTSPQSKLIQAKLMGYEDDYIRFQKAIDYIKAYPNKAFAKVLKNFIESKDIKNRLINK